MTVLQPIHIDRSSVFDPKRYMALRGVEETYAQIDGTAAFKELLDDFGRLLLTSAGAEDLGIFLLHRHFAVGPASIPLERGLAWGESGEYALVTRPSIVGPQEKYAPSRWKYDPHSEFFEALEYSTDQLVLDRWAILSSSPEVSVAAARILEKSGLWSFLGLTIAGRSSLPRKAGEVYVETSDVSTLASVVRVEAKGTSSGKAAIPTVWVPATLCWCEETMLCASICTEYGSEHVFTEHFDVPDGGHHQVPCV